MTKTDCYINIIFFTEQLKVHNDESKNIFMYSSLEPNNLKSLDMYGQVRHISRVLSLLPLQQSLEWINEKRNLRILNQNNCVQQISLQLLF